MTTVNCDSTVILLNSHLCHKIHILHHTWTGATLVSAAWSGSLTVQGMMSRHWPVARFPDTSMIGFITR